ncbi:MAG: hydroxymethylglutaryl-CoA reductase, degradative [Bacteroidia bacterium]|nr:hydroxymethylglutaryl-CoA reductase, degradative [Bacteroidia bacterium]
MSRDNKKISGFSKLSKRGKIKWLVENFFKDPEAVARELMNYWLPNTDQQQIIDGFSENTISNFMLPFGVAPNFVVNGHTYVIPMVIEESSVVAAASAGAKFWMDRGGFKANVISTKKIGQVHFQWNGNRDALYRESKVLFEHIREEVRPITANMINRGGGILDIQLKDAFDGESQYYKLMLTFETCDSMGANFINSVLEEAALVLKKFVHDSPVLNQGSGDLDIIMSILSNYTPECLVHVEVACPIEELGTFPDGTSAEEFANRFYKAIRIAHIDTYRATTHNKGIFNGIDAVVLATGNDFRAVEACGHTYACRTGQYKSLTDCSIDDGIFKFWMDIPLAVGTVGGLTAIHPIAKRSLEMLGNPSASTLMMIIAATGLAQNFAALRSLITTGIQQGHMKLHLANILTHMKADENETALVKDYFENKTISFNQVRAFLDELRNGSSLHFESSVK